MARRPARRVLSKDVPAETVAEPMAWQVEVKGEALSRELSESPARRVLSKDVRAETVAEPLRESPARRVRDQISRWGLESPRAARPSMPTTAAPCAAQAHGASIHRAKAPTAWRDV